MIDIPNRSRSFWRNRRVLVTGHTGFKGSWLCLWLARLGADVAGYSLGPPTTPNLYEVANVSAIVRSHYGDVRDLAGLGACMEVERPEVVFHLAAQSLVQVSYADPITTYATNVMGTVNVLETARGCGSVRVVLVITSDKCYENREVVWGYREGDALGGRDPYSSSKACAEIVTAAYARSFFGPGAEAVVASARAGNVIGGGDWSADRLLPDCVRALLTCDPVIVRNPDSVRPWQHVLEPLNGYMLYAQALFEKRHAMPAALNFGPYETDIRSVSQVVQIVLDCWGEGTWKTADVARPQEAGLLSLDSRLARSTLDWAPCLSLHDAIRSTVRWYREYVSGASMPEFTLSQIEEYERLAGGSAK